jgi:hypothetical protein
VNASNKANNLEGETERKQHRGHEQRIIGEKLYRHHGHETESRRKKKKWASHNIIIMIKVEWEGKNN